MTTADDPLPFPAAGHPLWERLARFDFDAAGASRGDRPTRTFARRLGETQGWSHAFTARVIDEYRRFLFLAVAAGHPVCPSGEVDEAWHLHLTATRSYWRELCGQTLGRPLHHDASGGGPDEGRKHREMYRSTLASYREWFGAEPPPDIWPPAWRRFDAASVRRSVDLRDHWVIRRPFRWPRGRGTRATVATVPLVAAMPLVADGLGPFDLRGPEFMILFLGMWVLCWVATFVWRSMKSIVEVTDDRELTPEEVACLAHGPTPAVRATVAGMLKAGELKSETTGWWTGHATNFHLRTVAIDTPLEGEIAAAIRHSCSSEPRSLASIEIDAGVVSTADGIRRRLQERGWLLDDEQRATIATLPPIAFSLLLLCGLLKIAIGLSRDRPVGFLVLGCVVTVMTLVWAARAPYASQAGVDLITTLRARHRQQQAASATELVLLSGLFGAVALTGAELEPYRKVWQSNGPQDGGGGCGTGCSGGDGGGGGCGGGCGGCGGD